jgi:peroxiredoxin
VSGGQLTDSDNKSQTNRNRLIFIGGLFLLGIALALLLFGGDLFNSSAEQPVALPQIPANEDDVNSLTGMADPLAVGDKAYNFALSDLDGRPAALSDYAGQPVMVNFWATWCPPCRLEMPEFQRAFEAHQQDGLVILAVNEYEEAEDVRSFFYDEMGFTFTPLLDSDGEVGQAYGAAGLPATFFIGPDGEIVAIHRGLLSETQLDGYLAELIP